MSTTHKSDIHKSNRKHMPRVVFNTLGVCSIAIDGVVQSTVPSSCFRIATYLLLSGARMTASRQRLRSVFWPDADLKKAGANLRQNLVRIRRFQDEHNFCLIDSNFSLIFLLPDGVDWDLRVVLDALKHEDEASIISASESYGGDLLADIGASSLEFEEWLSEQRERLRSAMIEKLTSVLERDSGLSLSMRGLCARRLLVVDPCNEHAFRILMTEAAEQRDHVGLRLLFERCERQLMSELGVRSSEGTRGLYSQLTRALQASPQPEG